MAPREGTPIRHAPKPARERGDEETPTMTFSTTRNPDTQPAPKPAPLPPIVLPLVRVVPFDPWANSIDPERLTAEGRSAMPDHEQAPAGWFRLDPPTRARLAGLAAVLLTEYPPDPVAERYSGPYARLTKVRDLFGSALMGTWRPRERFEANGASRELVAHAARFFVEDVNERQAWERDYRTLGTLSVTGQVDMLKELLRKLDGTGGVVATLRAGRKRLDDILAALEQRLAGGGAKR
jgi:hypothetical protein